MREIFTAANLLSLLRIPLAALTYWALSIDETIVALGLIILAGITDLVDGYAARISKRRTGHANQLGVALDPTADKFFALVLMMGLIAFRDFPLWLALVLVARDLVILVAGMILLKRQSIVIPSNLPGKYYFASLAILLFSYVCEYDFGILLFLPIVAVFWIWSLIGYARLYMHPPIQNSLKPTKKSGAIVRTILTVVTLAVYVVMFVIEAPYDLW